MRSIFVFVSSSSHDELHASRITQVMCPCCADDVTNDFSICGVADWGTDNSHTSAAGHPKPRTDLSRDALSGREPQALPLRSTANVMAIAGFTESQLDACSVRCGIGDLTPIREAVHNIFRGIAMKFCGIVPTFILRVCFERAIATVDGMLAGATRRALRCHTSRSFSDSLLVV